MDAHGLLSRFIACPDMLVSRSSVHQNESPSYEVRTYTLLGYVSLAAFPACLMLLMYLIFVMKFPMAPLSCISRDSFQGKRASSHLQ